MLKKNYIIKNIKDEDEIFNDLVKIYYKIEDIKKINDDNIVGVLFHELMAFFVTSKCQINSKKYSKLYKSQQKFHFGKRQGVDILKKKNNSLLTKFLYKVYSFFSNSLFFNKKIFLGKNISLSLGDKLSLIFFCTLKRYKLIILDIEDIKINLNSKTELFFLKEIKKLLIKIT